MAAALLAIVPIATAHGDNGTVSDPQSPAGGGNPTTNVQVNVSMGGEVGAASGREDERCRSADPENGPDICAQWAAVRAARDSAHVARLSKNWNIAGLAALVLTLLATAWAALAARRAAVAAERAVHVSEDTAKRQLRAYVSLEKFQLDFRRDKSKRIVEAHFEGHWANAGQTPAVAYRTDINWQAFEGEIPSNFNFPPRPAFSDHSGDFILGPGAKAESVGDPFRLKDFESDIEAKKKIYVWAFAEYEDIFGESRRTEAAAEVLFRTLPDGKRQPSYRALDRFTRMDEDCMRLPTKRSS